MNYLGIFVDNIVGWIFRYVSDVGYEMIYIDKIIWVGWELSFFLFGFLL